MLRSAPKAASTLPSLSRYAATAVWSISSSTPDAYLSLVVFAPSAACQLVTSSAWAGRPHPGPARPATIVAGQAGLEHRLAPGPDRPQRFSLDDGGEPGQHAQRVDAGVQPAVAEGGRRPLEIVVVRVGEEHLGRDQVADRGPPGLDGPLTPADLGCEGGVIRHVHRLPSTDLGKDAPGVDQGRGGGLLNQQPGLGKPP